MINIRTGMHPEDSETSRLLGLELTNAVTDWVVRRKDTYPKGERGDLVSRDISLLQRALVMCLSGAIVAQAKMYGVVISEREAADICKDILERVQKAQGLIVSRANGTEN